MKQRNCAALLCFVTSALLVHSCQGDRADIGDLIRPRAAVPPGDSGRRLPRQPQTDAGGSSLLAACEKARRGSVTADESIKVLLRCVSSLQELAEEVKSKRKASELANQRYAADLFEARRVLKDWDDQQAQRERRFEAFRDRQRKGMRDLFQRLQPLDRPSGVDARAQSFAQEAVAAATEATAGTNSVAPVPDSPSRMPSKTQDSLLQPWDEFNIVQRPGEEKSWDNYLAKRLQELEQDAPWLEQTAGNDTGPTNIVNSAAKGEASTFRAGDAAAAAVPSADTQQQS